MTFWAVRAGKHGDVEEYAIDQGVVAIGWDEVGDLASLTTREAIFGLLTEIHPDKKISTFRIPKPHDSWRSRLHTPQAAERCRDWSHKR
jgi:predicted Mrr-cat superfamily restriction endonuclease